MRFRKRSHPDQGGAGAPESFTPSSKLSEGGAPLSGLSIGFQPSISVQGREPEVYAPPGDGASLAALPPSETAPPPADDFTLEQWLEGIGLEWDKDQVSPTVRPDGPSPERRASNFSPLELRDRVVIMLLFKELVRVEQVEQAWVRWKKMAEAGSSEPLWRLLAQEKGVEAERVYAEAAEVYAFKRAVISTRAAATFIKDNQKHFTEGQWLMLRDNGILPVSKEAQGGRGEEKWILAANDPARPEVGRVLQKLGITSFELRYLSAAAVQEIAREAFPRKNEYMDRVTGSSMAYDLGASFEQERTQLIDEDALEAEIGRSALINLFEATLVEAVHQGASDIHIFPNPDRCTEIHFRVDGELKCWHVEQRVHPEAFLAVVKDNSINVDRFEKDCAQDGFIQRWIEGALIRFRVSVLPIASSNQDLRAESIVIRVLDDRKVVTDLGRLGFADHNINVFLDAITQPYGMVVITGPTGSGKSTTLIAALGQVVTPKVNVLTIEDPVEYMIPGVRQIKLNPKLGLEEALRSVLRHDPDVVMVGEMRDAKSADLAIKLSNTGHLTFSTLHTNDAPSAINRLYKMGIEPFLIAYTINLIVAQRLVRVLCAQCKQPEERIDPLLLERMGFTEEETAEAAFYRAGNHKECPVCKGAGYKGRQAVLELLSMTDPIRHIILMSKDVVDEAAIRVEARRAGMLTLQDSARELVRSGRTSLAEIMRVVSMK